ncbi:MAG: hypothetical protein BWY15_01565 [Firmicutes bacterium ADurb.Bin193]|nr:MAG: hypothetical protein BWY15_01565 [Firmicutes bacterium ADurb.Bin193]
MDFDNARVMLAICAFLAVMMLIVIGIFTRNFKQPKWSLFIPTLICLVIMIPCFVIIILPSNGIGKYTDLEYFGVFMYAFWTFIFTGIGEIIIFIIKSAIKK